MRRYTTKVDRHGRIVIPSEYRRALGMQPGGKVTISLKDGELRVATLQESIRRAQELVAPCTSDGRSLVDELIAERRAEAARD